MTIRADLDHHRQRRKRRWVALAATLAGMIVLCLALTGVWLHRLTFADLPPTPDAAGMQAVNRPPSVVFLDRNGTEIGRRGPGGAEVLRLGDLPAFVPQAFLAAEDRRFYSHFGVDPIAVLRAARANLRSKGIREGGSTITQQIARTLFLSPEQTLRRKLQEAALAVRIEQRMSKAEILRLYLNRIYFGAGAYGLDAAARTYFDKSARTLTLSEAALLAALPKAPTRLAPTNGIDAALARSRLVLARMQREGWITPQQAADALADPPELARETPPEEAFGYVLDRAAAEARAFTPGGATSLVVTLSVDAELQREARAAVRQTALANKGRGAEQGALVALAPDGGILALVGGVDHRDSSFDRAVQAKRQPGSAFKPFVYAAALETGVKPQDIRRDEPVAFKDWRPQNADGRYAGDVTVSEALVRSINTISVKLTDSIGPERVARLARRFGLGSIPPRPSLSVALGTYEVRLIDLVSAYQVFQLGGLQQRPHLLQSLATPEGAVLWRRPAAPPIQVYERALNGQMVRMLRGVIENGTGRGAVIGRPAAGKTGTTQNNRDAWFVGFTPDIVMGVWIGNDAARPMKEVAGAELPARIWRRVMLKAHEDLPVRGFDAAGAPDVDDPRAAFYQQLAAELDEAAAQPASPNLSTTQEAIAQ